MRGRATIAGIIVLLAGCSKAADVPLHPAKNLNDLASQIKALPDGTPVRLLFVVGAKGGTIAKIGEGRRELTLKTSDVTSILGFTDRPQRHAFSLTPPMLASIWMSGKDSFAKDPPNAIIEDSRSRLGVTEVTGFNVKDGIITVELDRMAYKSVDKGDSLDGDVEGLTLFIDSKFLGLKITGAGIAFGLQQAAKACVSVDCEFWPLGA